MKKYVKIYCDFFGYGEQDYIPCEIPNCKNSAEKPHHIIYKSQGGKDTIENLIGLCRKHHNQGHFKEKPYLHREELQNIHNKFMQEYFVEHYI